MRGFYRLLLTHHLRQVVQILAADVRVLRKNRVRLIFAVALLRLHVKHELLLVYGPLNYVFQRVLLNYCAFFGQVNFLWLDEQLHRLLGWNGN